MHVASESGLYNTKIGNCLFNFEIKDQFEHRIENVE